MQTSSAPAHGRWKRAANDEAGSVAKNSCTHLAPSVSLMAEVGKAVVVVYSTKFSEELQSRIRHKLGRHLSQAGPISFIWYFPAAQSMYFPFPWKIYFSFRLSDEITSDL